MNVGELIARLQNYHDATPVLVDGYEDGFDELYLHLARVSRVGGSGWWSGDYQEDERSGREALILSRHKAEDL